MMSTTGLFCKGGGCTAKLGPGILAHVLEKIERGEDDPNLLVGFDSNDDAAVYRVSPDVAVVQTLDFFPPMVEDPYTFGQIAATNALSDVYAMGGEVKTALNIVCFPQEMDLNILGEIMRGGSEKVVEAGGVLCGGHSINDTDVKYGLSVIGTVHPDHIYTNNGGQPGDALILTKKLGIGIVSTAHRAGVDTQNAMPEAIVSMTTLNKYAAQIAKPYTVHACTDVTGFGFLGHLHEMLDGRLAAVVDTLSIPYIRQAYAYAADFLLTAAAQRNRNHVEPYVDFKGVPFPMQEILFDPQTSGGLLIAVPAEERDALLRELADAKLPAAVVGRIIHRDDPNYAKEITVL